ncbi:MAG: DNA double-strand break repair nuclease NurA [Gloeomargaritaceae cyanobacterium C42_A2020_066]|nr:DNA double-strand break repair nuclease NurA [Gloeomargaritaceae cyanobacterium C42_A2020_066]
MLDLVKVGTQVEGLSAYLAEEKQVNLRHLKHAQTFWQQAQAQPQLLLDRHPSPPARPAFTTALPLEPLDTCITLEPAPNRHTVLATDGSQIAPSHHEIAYCYLINIGYVALQYGSGRPARLDSIPEIFYKTDDLYRCRRWGLRTEDWMGHRRTQMEMTLLAELTTQWRAQHPDEPAVALVDGSLTYWFLEPLPAEARTLILEPILAAWQQLRTLRVPVVSYLSASRSIEVLNSLRLLACPYPEIDCQAHCRGQAEGAPCDQWRSLRDTSLAQTQLQPGQRGPRWQSTARILETYGESTIHFCYLHAGAEVARLEFPSWLDTPTLNIALGLVLAQVTKGYGYPVALAEAHNQAVVRGQDRSRFFSLVNAQLIRQGMGSSQVSAKEARKRISPA